MRSSCNDRISTITRKISSVRTSSAAFQTCVFVLFQTPYADELNQFVKSASSHRDEPVIIVDIRDNHGGNERLPINWIRGLTGQQTESVFVFSELIRQNYNGCLEQMCLPPCMIERRVPLSTRMMQSDMPTLPSHSNSGEHQPSWVGPYYPLVPLIANYTTVILVTPCSVSSSGEGLIMRLSQAENVVVVGAISMG